MSDSINMMLSRLLEDKVLVNGLPSAAYTDKEFWEIVDRHKIHIPKNVCNI